MHVVAVELVDGVRHSVIGVRAVVRVWYLVLRPGRNCLEEHEMLVLQFDTQLVFQLVPRLARLDGTTRGRTVVRARKKPMVGTELVQLTTFVGVMRVLLVIVGAISARVKHLVTTQAFGVAGTELVQLTKFIGVASLFLVIVGAIYARILTRNRLATPMNLVN